jgi:tRNA (mo5U34)-methyltransferase
VISPAQIAERIEELGEWGHNLNLGGVWTNPRHLLGDYPAAKWQRFAHALPEDLTGKTVLDLGCNAGFFSLELKRRGAARVVGVDHDERCLAQARFAAEVQGAQIEFKKLEIWDVGALKEKFDVVLFLGVLDHLRHPLLALDLLHQHVVRDLLVFGCLQRGGNALAPLELDYPLEEEGVFERPEFPKLSFVEHEYANDWTTWWIPNRACAEAMLRASGFQIVSHPEAEIYICRRRELPNTPRAVYPTR